MTKEMLCRLLDDIQKVQAVWLVGSLLLKVRLNINRERIINSKGSESKISSTLDMILRRKEVRRLFAGQRLLIGEITKVSARGSLGNRVPDQPEPSTHTECLTPLRSISHSLQSGKSTSAYQGDGFHCDVSILRLQGSTTLFCVEIYSLCVKKHGLSGIFF